MYDSSRSRGVEVYNFMCCSASTILLFKFIPFDHFYFFSNIIKLDDIDESTVLLVIIIDYLFHNC